MRERYNVTGYAEDGHLPVITREDALMLTHLNVAFGQVRNDEVRIDHLQHLDRLQELKLYNPELTVLLSVGGLGSGGFSEAASSVEGRRRMTDSAIRALEKYPFDGIDIDWEFPCYALTGIHASPDDRTNYTLLLRELREALNRKGEEAGRHYLLTIAAGAEQYYLDGTEMDQVQDCVDFVQIMTYDLRGPFQMLTGHHTNLFTPTGDFVRSSVDASVRKFCQAGVPRDKIVVGAAFYSRIWDNVMNVNHGLIQPSPGFGDYGPDYSGLAAEYIDKNGFVRYWDDEAKAPFLFNGSRFITYDDEQSLGHKCDYVKNNGLAGIMFWEYGGDTTHRLLEAIYAGLGNRR
jgi:chitinase